MYGRRKKERKTSGTGRVLREEKAAPPIRELLIGSGVATGFQREGHGCGKQSVKAAKGDLPRILTFCRLLAFLSSSLFPVVA